MCVCVCVCVYGVCVCVCVCVCNSTYPVSDRVVNNIAYLLTNGILYHPLD